MSKRRNTKQKIHMDKGLVFCRGRNRMRRFMVGLTLKITARSLTVFKQVARAVCFCTIRAHCLKRTVNKTHRCVWLIMKRPTKKSDQNYVTYRRRQMSQITSVRACYSFRVAVKLRSIMFTRCNGYRFTWRALNAS